MEKYLSSIRRLYVRWCNYDIKAAMDLESKPILEVYKFGNDLDNDRDEYYLSLLRVAISGN